MFKIAFASALLVITSGMLAQTRNTEAPELARIQSEYSDVLALQGTAKAEVLANRSRTPSEARNGDR